MSDRSEIPSDNKIDLKSVRGILNMKFFVPDYQRGYRWTEQQVEDLLNDIYEFNEGKNEGEFYCLQPLVVKANGDFYEVIDGQQRLTTLYLILEFLGVGGHYELTYETREGSGTSLKDIATGKGADDSIDSFHMSNAYVVISKWFDERKDKKVFLEKLLDDVNFIWYELGKADNSVEVFTRLNTGKIPLTNAELIKALFLNSSNFTGRDVPELQRNIASDWYEIELKLHKDSLWLFLRDYKDDERANTTRINFIFDIICDRDKFGLELSEKELGSDDYRTFRYFYEYFKRGEDALNSWEKVMKLFRTFETWYNDINIHNYAGYLIALNKENILPKLLDNYSGRDNFINYLKDEIIKEIAESECLELDDDHSTVDCKPLLLLHNIETQTDRKERFEFDEYKTENWDVEHIDSKTPSNEDSKDKQDVWLCSVFYSVNKETQEKIADFAEDENRKDFESIKKLIPDSLMKGLGEDQKDKIWNYALLDQSTNRGYKNAIFAEKKRIIKGKDEGKILPRPKIKRKNGKLYLDYGKSTEIERKFIPVSTREVFCKFNINSASNCWDETLAGDYKKDIYNKLKKFGVKSKELSELETKKQ